MSITTVQLIIVLLSFLEVKAQTPASPCPSIFKYESKSPYPDRWYGAITLTSDIELRGVWLHLMFDKSVKQLGNWLGPSQARNFNTEFMISDPNYVLAPGISKRVRFYVQYDTSQPPPRLMGFLLNSKPICPEEADGNVLAVSLQASGQVDAGSSSVPAGGAQRFPINLVSPCPRLFVYETTSPERDRWYGIVTLLNPTDLKGVWLRLNFDRPVIRLGNWFGQVKVRNENMEFVVNDRNFQLKAGVPQTVRIYVQFDTSQPPPQLTGFKLNARTHCPEGLEDEATTGMLELQTSNPADVATTLAPASAVVRPPKPISAGSVNNQYQMTAPGRVSPCPRLFTYEPSSPEPDRWYGLVTLLSENELKGVWLRLMFDKPVLDVGTDFGKADERDGKKDYLINDRNFKLQPRVPQVVRFSVQYNPNEPPPRLIGFRLNSRPQCPEQTGMDATTPTLELQTSNELQPGVSAVKPETTTKTIAPIDSGGHQYQVSVQGRVSPCPRLFVYQSSSPEPDRWYGLITLLSMTDLKGIWLRVIFDRPVLTVGTFFGESRKRDDDVSYLIHDRNFKLAAGVPQSVRFYVQYDTSQPAPQLVGFKLNARDTCPEGGGPDATTPTLELQTSNDIQPTVKPVAAATTKKPTAIGGGGGGHQYQVATQGRVSPCPRLFVYEANSPEPDRWYGLITLLTMTDLKGVWLRLIFDKPPINVGTFFGDVRKRDDDLSYLIHDRNFKLAPGVPQSVRFYVQYDTSQPAPQLVGFKLNARDTCPEGGGPDATTPTLELQTSNDIQPTVKPVAAATTKKPTAIGGGGGGHQYQVATQGRVSPCPRLFVYEANSPEPDRWYGLITLLTMTDLKGVWLRLIFDKPPINVGTFFGDVRKRDDDLSYLIHDRNFKLAPGVPQSVRFYVQYDTSQPAPQLVGFKLNARDTCPEGGGPDATTPTLELQTSNDIQPTVKPVAAATTKKPTAIGGGGGGHQYEVATQGRVSPCPRLFVYEANSPEPDRWYGLITLLTMTDLKGVWLRLIFDKPPINVGTFFGDVRKRDDDVSYLIHDRNFKLAPGVPQSVRFYVQYDTSQPTPQLVGFKLNARDTCPEGGGPDATTPTLELQTSNDIQPTVKPVAAATTNKPTAIGGGGGGHQYEVATQGRVSPCPRLFVYEANSPEPDRWYGLITLLTMTDLKGVWLRLIFDKPVINVGTFFGDVRKRDDDVSYLIHDRNFKLAPGVPQSVRFYVQYDTSQPAPQLVGFKLNARDTCPEGGGPDSTTPTLELQTSNDVQPASSTQGGSNVDRLEPTKISAISNAVSPCPRLFVYEPTSPEPDRWYGVVILLNDLDLVGVWLRLMFDKPVMEVGSTFGKAEERDGKINYLISNREFKLKAKTPHAVRFYVKFNPGEAPPRLTGFKLNARSQCPEGSEAGATTKAPELQTSNDFGPTASPVPGGSAIEIPMAGGGQYPVVAESPCPRLFAYEPTSPQPDRWYGIITLLNENDLNGIWLRLNFDRPVLQIGNWFGKVKVRNENMEFVISNRDRTLKAGVPQPVRFYVTYDTSKPAPRLIGFKINARTHCPEGAADETTMSTMELQTSNILETATGASSNGGTGGNQAKPDTGVSQGSQPEQMDDEDFYPGDHAFLNHSLDTIFGTVDNYDDICGTTVRPKQTMQQSVNEGMYPWHAAVYHTKGINLVYWCGAVLVSKSHVVTVAHCVTKWRTSTARDPENFVIYMGKFYLNRFTRGVQERVVDQIVPHPEYSPEKLCNDIAVMKFVTPVEFSDYIRPVCLWKGPKDLNLIANEEGSVAGWGVDAYGKQSEQLTHTQAIVGSLETCVQTLPNFYPLFIDNTTFCSGFRRSAPMCNGDSGNAMVFPRRNEKDNSIKWHLRGLLSLSVDSSNRFKCDVSHYLVFTDIAKYVDWLKLQMRRF